jgi:hypothetical protein
VGAPTIPEIMASIVVRGERDRERVRKKERKKL